MMQLTIRNKITIIVKYPFCNLTVQITSLQFSDFLQLFDTETFPSIILTVKEVILINQFIYITQ